MNFKFIQYGLAHALIRDLMFLGLYKLFILDGMWTTNEMILSFLIPFVIAPLIIGKLFRINYIVPIIISCITLVVPNFIPNIIWFTYSKNTTELMRPFGLSIVCYILLYFIFSLFIQ